MATLKQQSNPFSTGGGGVNFETRVQAAFAVSMLSGGVAPCLPSFSITGLKLQGRYLGFHTDDLIVLAEQPQTGEEAKLLIQIKRDISITEASEIFAEVIKNAWADFKNENFNHKIDAIALITASLSKDATHVRSLLEWARYSVDENEFFHKVNTEQFSSQEKRNKLQVFRIHLKTANQGTEVSDEQLWEFLKIFHLIGYDLDTESGSTLSLLLSLISKCSSENPQLVWSRVLDVVQTANQNAGTLSLKTLPKDIIQLFNNVNLSSRNWQADIKKFSEHGNLILGQIRSTIADIYIKRPEIEQLIDLSESSNFIFITGERGVGKSSLVKVFAEHFSQNTPIFCLRAEEFEQPHLDNLFSAIGLKNSLSDLETGFALIPRKYLVIESLEKILELNNRHAFTDLLLWLKRQCGWTVIATVRDYAYHGIIFSYFQSSDTEFNTLTLSKLGDDQLQDLCIRLEVLQKIAKNSNLKQLLKYPFYAEIANRIPATGVEFTSEEGEKEFRLAVWQYIIEKREEGKNGMPSKRKQTFMNVAVQRAKKMVYGVLEKDFDSEVVDKLVADNLIYRNPKNLLSPAHDVLEDWAIEEYIEEIYQQNSDSIGTFIEQVGHEPAMNRAFRLWLHSKLKTDENISDFIYSILDNKNIQPHWQDATIAAILLGDNPDNFLEALRGQLLMDNEKLLKRFCFILRIACKIPNKDRAYPKNLFFQPHGQGWQALIDFIFDNKEYLSQSILSDVVPVLEDWTGFLPLDREIPPSARKTGLLALYLLHPLKDSYEDTDYRDSLLKIIIKITPAISEEFIDLLEQDVFLDKKTGRKDQLRYVKQFCDLCLTSFNELAFLCKHQPDIVIKLAKFRWFLDEEKDNHRNRDSSREEKYFGLSYDYGHGFSSGLKGPFQRLLTYHPNKALDFILELLNRSAKYYAHSDLDHPTSRYHGIRYPEPCIEQVEIQLEDGSIIKQYCSGRLWSAYKGFSVVPNVLQCALMALENWLIACVENYGQDIIKWLFDYILRNSNSVMSTAILASVATGFPSKTAKFALPLLRVPELYLLDLGRPMNERGEQETNWFAPQFRQDYFNETYTQERRTAAQRHWRKETLESLIMRLQFSEWRDDALAAIDAMRSSVESYDGMVSALFHRIDSRGWKPIINKENNTISFEPKNIEPELVVVQQRLLEQTQIHNRFAALNLWATHTFKGESLEREYYQTWDKALLEAKELSKKYEPSTTDDIISILYRGIITAAAVFIKEHSRELTIDDVLWCRERIISTVVETADTHNYMGGSISDEVAAAASVLPILLDFATDDEKITIKHVIATALTHADQNIRHQTANGIRLHLWQRDEEFAQNCFIGAIAYARFKQENSFREYPPFWVPNYNIRVEEEQLKWQAQEEEFRDQLAQGQFLLSNFDPITLQTHEPNYTLAPNLMIAYESTRAEHLELFSQMLNLFFKYEQDENKNYSGRIDPKIELEFTKHFAKHLLCTYKLNLLRYLEQLKEGCVVAPRFMRYLILCIAVESEKINDKSIYWDFCQKLSNAIQRVALEMLKDKEQLQQRDKRDLILGALQAELDWKGGEQETKDIALGKSFILEFAKKTGKNPIVFGALAKLIHHFPSVLFETGISILAEIYRTEGRDMLSDERNTGFYLEWGIQRFLDTTQTRELPKKIYESCLILLDACVETTSPRAYFLRESLVRTYVKKI